MLKGKKLTEQDVEAVEIGLKKKLSVSEISKMTGVSASSIRRIRNGKHTSCKKELPTSKAVEESGTASIGEVLVHNIAEQNRLLVQIFNTLTGISAKLDAIANDTRVVADDLKPMEDEK